MAFAHELSWSVSRSGTFANCKRRYYNDYYFSWNGWDRSSPEARTMAWRLKKMTRMPMLAGDVLHQAIAEYFDRQSEGTEMLEDQLIGFAMDKLRVGYRQSRDGQGLWRSRPGQSVHLAEHHFKEGCVDETTEAAKDYGMKYRDRIISGAKYFMTAAELASLHSLTPENVLCVEGRPPGHRENRDFATIQLFDTKVFAIPDFACKSVENGREQYFIYDWKSGAPRELDEFQLGVYALYAMQKWGASPEQITCVDVYLPTGEIKSKCHTQDELDTILARMETSLGEMQAVHFDAGLSAGSAEDFPMTEEGSYECGTCNYREMCERV